MKNKALDYKDYKAARIVTWGAVIISAIAMFYYSFALSSIITFFCMIVVHCAYSSYLKKQIKKNENDKS